MLNNRTARPFHQGICASCHRVPGMEGWMKAEIRNELGISHSIKKRGMWEPFYIGTNREPYFDERLSWEGRLNKLTQVCSQLLTWNSHCCGSQINFFVQAYSMCLLDYDYHVLDNAFLVHKPGIKTFHLDPSKRVFRQQNLWFVRHEITSELHALYGDKNICSTTPWY